mmetsp:Transcript_24821/g.86432  ORF Transcript_24821/g.86432 Transcript_24821/m.86432 type:complete len:417 (+) Transcript_24821:863-2113(+)
MSARARLSVSSSKMVRPMAVTGIASVVRRTNADTMSDDGAGSVISIWFSSSTPPSAATVVMWPPMSISAPGNTSCRSSMLSDVATNSEPAVVVKVPGSCTSIFSLPPPTATRKLPPKPAVAATLSSVISGRLAPRRPLSRENARKSTTCTSVVVGAEISIFWISLTCVVCDSASCCTSKPCDEARSVTRCTSSTSSTSRVSSCSAATGGSASVVIVCTSGVNGSAMVRTTWISGLNALDATVRRCTSRSEGSCGDSHSSSDSLTNRAGTRTAPTMHSMSVAELLRNGPPTTVKVVSPVVGPWSGTSSPMCRSFSKVYCRLSGIQCSSHTSTNTVCGGVTGSVTHTMAVALTLIAFTTDGPKRHLAVVARWSLGTLDPVSSEIVTMVPPFAGPEIGSSQTRSSASSTLPPTGDLVVS